MAKKGSKMLLFPRKILSKVFVGISLLALLFLAGIIFGSIHTSSTFSKDAYLRSIRAKMIAIKSFYETYKFLPGDFPNASERFDSCVNCDDGDGNGIIGDPQPSMAFDHAEVKSFWKHLHEADLSSLHENGEWKTIPFYYDGKSESSIMNKGELPKGHYLTILTNSGKNYFFKTETAERMDLKFDDGLPLSGWIRGLGENKKCISAEPNAGAVYNRKYQRPCVSLYFSFPGD